MDVGFFSSSLNLIKTIMGTGMLVLPFAFQNLSIIPAILLLGFAAIVSGFGLYLLTRASLRVAGGRNCDFAILSRATYPSLVPVFELTILVKCLGVTVSYMTMASQLLPQALGIIYTIKPGSFLAHPALWVTVGTLLITPIVCMPKMDSLKYTSFIGMAGIIYLVCLSVYQAITFGSVANLHWFEFKGWLVFLKNFSIFIFAFTCHQNMLPIQNEARNNSNRGMIQLIGFCVSWSMTLYTCFAVCSVAVFGGGAIPKSIFTAYSDGSFKYSVATVLYSFLVLFSIPLQTFPARNSFLKVVAYFNADYAAEKRSQLYMISTGSILATCWLISCTELDIDDVLKLVGATAGPVLCFILPSIFWLKLEAKASWTPLKVAALLLLVFGVVSVPLLTATIFVK